jgi:serine/threonine protein kinase
MEDSSHMVNQVQKRVIPEEYRATIKKLKLTNSWAVAFKNYNLQKVLGAGSYGKVVLAICKTTGRSVAIKFISGFFANEYECVKVARELIIQRLLSQMPENLHAVPLYDLFVGEEDVSDPAFGLFMVMEHVQSDLKQMMSQTPRIKLKEGHVITIIYNILCAMKFLHSANVIHRDLKPGNILIQPNCKIRICDFGLSRTLPESCVGKGSGNSKRVRDSIRK